MAATRREAGLACVGSPLADAQVVFNYAMLDSRTERSRASCLRRHAALGRFGARSDRGQL